MKTAVRRAIAAATICAAVTSAVAISPLAAVAENGSAKQAHPVSDFGYKGTAVGARLFSDNVEHLHAQQAAAPLRCSRSTGRDVSASGPLTTPDGSLVELSDAASRTQSYREGSRYGVRATNALGDLSLGIPGQTALVTLKGLTTTAEAFHDRTGYGHAESINYSFFQIELLPDTVPEGPLGDLLDAIGQGAGSAAGDVIQVLGGAGAPIEIPGLGSIALGAPGGKAGKYGADSNVHALQFSLDVDGADERLLLGQSRAVIGGPAPVGVFNSSSTPLSMNAADGTLRFGHVKPMTIPCAGTRGKVKQRHLDHANIVGGGAVVNMSDIDYSSMGRQSQTGAAKGFSRQAIGRIEINAGKLLVIRDVVAKSTVRVSRASRKIRHGLTTRVGGITYDGVLLTLKGDTTELPGGAGYIEQRLVSKGRTKVTALRITLTGVDVVVDLGTAATRIRRR